MYDIHRCKKKNFRYDVDSASRNLKDHVSTRIFFFFFFKKNEKESNECIKNTLFCSMLKSFFFFCDSLHVPKKLIERKKNTLLKCQGSRIQST